MDIGFGIGDAPTPPKVFVSSTFYDLRSVRQDIEDHLQGLGLEPVLFENAAPLPNISAPFSALRHASQANICLLIVGSRYGSHNSDNGISWTHTEFRLARDLKKPIFTFIEQETLTKYDLARSRPMSDLWTSEEKELFSFIDELSNFGSRFSFSNIIDLKKTITFHFAAYFGYLIKKYSDLELSSPKSASSWNSIGVIFADRGEFEKAVYCYRQAVLLLPNDPMYFTNLVSNLRRTGNLAEAENEVRKGINKFPNYIEKLKGILSLILRDKGDLQGAEDICKELVGQFPSDDRAWISLASILRIRGKYSDAQEAIRKALEIDPHNVVNYQRYMDLGGDPDLLVRDQQKRNRRKKRGKDLDDNIY